MHNKKGFTLIELLIVVAIIAILAAIAVPNFLEAQTRSKVSRVKAELRSLATGLESYFTDHNAYVTGYGHYVEPMHIYGLFLLSTPIAYLTQPMLRDPFWALTGSGSSGAWRSLYIYRGHKNDFEEDSGASPGKVVGWCMWSRGPDRSSGIGKYDPGDSKTSFFYIDGLIKTNDVDGMIDSVYDATNGTVSNGNIYRVGGMLNECLRAISRID